MKSIILFISGLAVSANCATYNYSGPINGSFDFFISNSALFGNPLYSGFNYPAAGGTVAFTSLSETIYLDPVAGTIRQVGVISLSQTSFTRTLVDNQMVNGVVVPASVTLNFGVTGGNLSFDTGPLPFTESVDSGYKFYGFSTGSAAFEVPVNGSYSWTTGDETFTGTFGYNMMGFYPYNTAVVAIDDPSQMILKFPMAIGFGNPIAFTQINSTNGLSLALVAGRGGDLKAANWTGPIFATIVPEPSAATLLSAGLLSLAILRRGSQVIGQHD